jgi:hypothetical protein
LLLSVTDCVVLQADIVGRKFVIGLADAIFIIGAGSSFPLPLLVRFIF